MSTPQPGIFAPVPSFSRYLEFGAVPGGDPKPVLRELASRSVDPSMVTGIGPGLIQGLGRQIEGLRPFPSLSGPGCEVPSTQAHLWCWIRGDDRGRITHAARAVVRLLQPAFRLDRLVDGFKLIFNSLAADLMISG